ncbi:glycosyltransferase, partial [Acetomicrobium mobile]
MSKIKVSVIIPAYNAASTIERTLKSLFSQS